MIDIKDAKEKFRIFTNQYDKNNGRILQKIKHSYRVSENAKTIAQNIGLDEEKVKLAELIGLLHDIGRFEQIKRFNMYKDSKSINHGQFGADILIKEGLIRNYIKTSDYDQLIYKAVYFHNKSVEKKEWTEEEKLFIRIIRDADVLDIYTVLLEEKTEIIFDNPTENIEYEKITPKVYKEFKNIYSNINVQENRDLLYKDEETNIDHILTWMVYPVGLNFKESLEIIKKNKYIDRIIDRFNYEDNETYNKMQEVKEIVNNYINKNI